jgi:hypothetical protein
LPLRGIRGNRDRRLRGLEQPHRRPGLNYLNRNPPVGYHRA